jgi:hypothetical protein
MHTQRASETTDIDTSGRGGPERKAEATQRDLVVLGSWLPSAACTHTVSTSYNLRLLDTLVVRLFTCMYVVPRGPCESRDVCRIRHKRYECRIGAGDAATSSFDNRYCSTTETFPIRTSHARAYNQASTCSMSAYNSFPKNSGNTGISTPNGNRDINTHGSPKAHIRIQF